MAGHQQGPVHLLMLCRPLSCFQTAAATTLLVVQEFVHVQQLFALQLCKQLNRVLLHICRNGASQSPAGSRGCQPSG